MTIQEIITGGQKQRHDNHVKAGKSIKEKWKQEARKELIEEFEKMVDLSNIDVSSAFFNDKCENCEKSIEPSIHHFVDYFYKSLKYQLKQMKEEK